MATRARADSVARLRASDRWWSVHPLVRAERPHCPAAVPIRAHVAATVCYLPVRVRCLRGMAAERAAARIALVPDPPDSQPADDATVFERRAVSARRAASAQPANSRHGPGLAHHACHGRDCRHRQAGASGHRDSPRNHGPEPDANVTALPADAGWRSPSVRSRRRPCYPIDHRCGRRYAPSILEDGWHLRRPCQA